MSNSNNESFNNISAASGTFANSLTCNGPTNVGNLSAKSGTFTRNISCVGLTSSNGISASGTTTLDILSSNNTSVSSLQNSGDTQLNGNLNVIGSTSLNGSLKLPIYSTSEMNSIEEPAQGMLIYNSSMSALYIYSNKWEQVAGDTTNEILQVSGLNSSGSITSANGLTVNTGFTTVRDLSAINITNTGFLNVSGSSNLGNVYAGPTNVASLVNTGNELINGNLSVNNKFNIDNQSGNTEIYGSLSVKSTSNLCDVNITSLSNSGNATINGSLIINGSTELNDVTVTEFNNSGHETISGDLSVDGISSLNAINATDISTITINNTGDAQIGGNLNVIGSTVLNGLTCGQTNVTSLVNSGNETISGDLIVNTDKFTVDSISGDTNISGVLNVNNNAIINGLTISSLKNSGNTQLDGTLNVNKNSTMKNISCGSINATSLLNSGNESVNGTLHVTGVSTVNALNAGTTTVTSLTNIGNETIGGTLNAGNTTVTSLINTGNETINGNLTLGQNKFTVDTNGNTNIAGKLIVSGVANLGTLNSNTTYVTKLTNSGPLLQSGDINVNNNKFIVSAATGNTTIVGNLIIGGDLITHGSSVTNDTVVNEYDHINITQNPTNTLSAFSITRDSESTGSLMQIINPDKSNMFEITNDGSLKLNNNFTVDNFGNVNTNQLTANATSVSSLINSGNESISGNLIVSGTTKLTQSLTLPSYSSSQLSSISATNGTIIYNTTTNSIYVYQNNTWSAISDKFNATSANFSDGITCNNIIANNLSANGITYLKNVNVSQISNSGNESISGNLSVNTNKFTVDASSGNVDVAGNIIVHGYTNIKSLNATDIQTTSITNTGNEMIFGNLNVSGSIQSTDLSVNTFKTNSMTNGGDQLINGNLKVAGMTKLTTLTAGETNVSSLINSGITAIRGSLSVNTNKFNVTASTGDTNIAGNLKVVGSANIGLLSTNDLIVTSLSNSGNMIMSGNLNINNKVIIDNVTGNTNICGSLNVGTITSLNTLNCKDTIVNGNINFQSMAFDSDAALNDSILDLSKSTSSLITPKGKSNDRPNAIEGMIRYNTDIKAFEGYSSDTWGSLANGSPIRLSIATNSNMLNIPGFESGYVWLNPDDRKLYINSITGIKTIPLMSASNLGDQLINVDSLSSSSSSMVRQPNMPYDDITIYYDGVKDKFIIMTQTNYLAEYLVNVTKNGVGDYSFGFVPQKAGARTFDNAIMYSFIADNSSSLIIPKVNVVGGLLTRVTTYNNLAETDAIGYFSFKIRNSNPNNNL